MISSKNKKESNIKTVKWIYSYVKRYIPAVILISVMMAVVSLSAVLLALESKEVLDIATGTKQGNIIKAGIILFIIVLVQILISGIDTVYKTHVSTKLNMLLRNKLFLKISRRKFSDVSKYHSGDLLNRMTSDISVVVSGVTNIIPSCVSMATKIIGGISALILLDKRVALLILVFGISVPAVGRLLNKKYKYLHKLCQKSEGETRSFMQECFANIAVLKVFSGQTSFSRKLDGLLDTNYRHSMKRAGISAVTHLSLYAFFTIGYYTVLVWGADAISAGAISYGTLMAFLQLVQQLRAPMQNVSGILPQYYSMLSSAERIIEIENGEYDKLEDSEKVTDLKKDFQSIEFKNVDFSYKDEGVLKNSSFSIEKGKITALTGESGSGKSTVFKLLLGLYDADAGEITINNNIPLDTSLRGVFAYVPQGNMILSGTVRENIALFNNNISEAELERAAKAACIYDIIEELPDGFDTELTERGGGLSEGQIQRISIARALLTDAPVLLLDEATSALDEATETEVLDNIKAMSDKTVVFITHRNTSLKVCDKIIRVEDKVFSVIKE